MAKQKTTPTGKVSIADLRSSINKRAGRNVAYNLNFENPTEVKYWIPTGSRWLDSIIAKGVKAGIPGGKISGLAGQPASGKSFLAAQITANAQKMGMTCVYFDSEAALDPTFLENAGINLDDLIYVQAKTVEFVLETIEHLLKTSDERMLIVWDSIALTPVKEEAETNFNPQASMALKARVLAEGMTALTDLVADKESTLLVLNQLKTNITSDWGAEAFRTPGGMSLKYAYSLEIWLTRRLAKAAYIKNDKGYNIGAEVKAELKKSRFGTERRQCAFNIMWGEQVGVQDEESWLEAISTSPHYSTGSWHCMTYADGTDTGKFRAAEFVERLQEPKFRERVLELMDEEIIQKFATMTGNASNFYDVDNSAGAGSNSEE